MKNRFSVDWNIRQVNEQNLDPISLAEARMIEGTDGDELLRKRIKEIMDERKKGGGTLRTR